MKVREIDAADLEAGCFRREHQKDGVPLVVRRLFDPAKIFSLEAFSQEMGDREVVVREFGTDRPPKWQWRGYGRWASIRFSDYLHMLQDGRARQRDIYLSQLPMKGIETAHRSTAWLDNLGERLGMRRLYRSMDGNIWIGPTGHVEPLHTDEGDGTLLQIRGRKKVVLFPASQFQSLYPFPLFSNVAPWVSQVDLDQPDFERFPKLAAALEHRSEAVLDPGDFLYLPTQWHHEASTLDGEPVVSINRLWHVKPWRRNFVTGRCALWYVKRKLPIAAVSRLHSSVVRLKRAADAENVA